MPLARWKDLCLDATAEVLPAQVRFLEAALGLRLERVEEGVAELAGATPAHTAWIDTVPEPRTDQGMVHLDLVGDLPPLLAAGATVLREHEQAGRAWTVVTDPDGGHHCVFADPASPTALVVGHHDPEPLAQWWAEVLGARLVPAPDGRRRWLEAVDGLPFDLLKVHQVGHRKAAKNRMHWDLVSDDVPGFVARGATVLREPGDDVAWHVLADPVGNEFCVFAP